MNVTWRRAYRPWRLLYCVALTVAAFLIDWRAAVLVVAVQFDLQVE